MTHSTSISNGQASSRRRPDWFALADGRLWHTQTGPSLFFEALDAIVVFAIARRFVPWHRVVPYITVLLFITANWEGQIYFSPQTTAFLLALLFQFFLLPLLEPARLRRPFRNWRWLHLPPLEIREARDEVLPWAKPRRSSGSLLCSGQS